MAAHPKALTLLDRKSATIKLRVPTRKITSAIAQPMERETIAAAKAKTHFLKLLDEVERDGQPITITKRGRVVAQLIPASEPQAISKFDQVFGRMAGTMKITGDIVSPDWEQWGPKWR